MSASHHLHLTADCIQLFNWSERVGAASDSVGCGSFFMFTWEFNPGSLCPHSCMHLCVCVCVCVFC